jgi:hypothetical protein
MNGSSEETGDQATGGARVRNGWKRANKILYSLTSGNGAKRTGCGKEMTGGSPFSPLLNRPMATQTAQ